MRLVQRGHSVFGLPLNQEPGGRIESGWSLDPVAVLGCSGNCLFHCVGQDWRTRRGHRRSQGLVGIPATGGWLPRNEEL